MCKTCVVPSSRTRERASNRSSSRRLKGYATDTTTKQKGTDSLDYIIQEKEEREAHSPSALLSLCRGPTSVVQRVPLSRSPTCPVGSTTRGVATRAQRIRDTQRGEGERRRYILEGFVERGDSHGVSAPASRATTFTPCAYVASGTVRLRG